MKKSTLSLIVAGMVAVGGVAQAETFNTPTQAGEASTMTMGQPNELTTNSPYGTPHSPYSPYTPSGSVYINGSMSSDTAVMGAAPNTMMVPLERQVYVQPGWNGSHQQRHEAAATFNTPARAGEASTMTNGQPNRLTDNQRIAADVHVPVYSVPSGPYNSAGSSYYGS